MRKLVPKTYQIPYPTAGSDILLKRIEYINEKDKIDVLIPNFDAELYTFIKASSKLKLMGIHTFLPTLTQFEERQKSVLPQFGKKFNITVPNSKPIFSEKDIYELKKDFEYPIVVKGKYYDAYIAYNPEQTKMYYYKISSKWGLPIIIQQFIKGTEVNVVAIGDGNGKTLGAVPMRKQYITDKGKAWSGITIDDKNIITITRKIIKKTKWRGGLELELIKTNDNEYYLIEINPRLPAWVYLAVGAGQNLPELLVQLALGMDVKPLSGYRKGKIFLRYSYELICDITDFEKLTHYAEL